jgi:uncharacterized protein YfaS (alpha-2-macroglobulin family)
MPRHALHFSLLFATLLAVLFASWAAPATPGFPPTEAAAPPTIHAATPAPTPQAAQAANAPRIVARQPPVPSVDERRPAVSLSFDQEMDRDSVATALSVEPAIPFSLRWQENTLYVDLLQPLDPGLNYHFSLDRSATSADGVSLRDTYSWAVRPQELLDSVAGPTVARPLAPLRLSFNYSMDAVAVEEALIIGPTIAGALTWNDERTIATFTPEKRFASGVTYFVSFHSMLREANGDMVPAPAPVTFTTPPPVVAVSPKTESAAPASAVRITFDRLMDQVATEAAFNIKPAVPGHFEWNETTLIFRPERGYFDENVKYTVTVSAAAKDSDGSAVVVQDYVWSFTTGSLEDVGNFGYGPNAQVVAADGRRAIQFVLTERDVAQVGFELYRLSSEQFLDRYSSSFRGVAQGEEKPISLDGATLAQSWPVDVSQTRSDDYGRSVQEVIIPPDVPPGFYILNLTVGHVNDQLIVVLTHHNVVVKQAEGQLIAWVTNINGEAVPNVRVGIYARDGQLIAEGRADELGVYRTAISRDPQPLIVIAGEGDDLTASGLTDEWRNGRYYWNWWQPAPKAQKYAAYIYTDRPIYRPGQTVYFKAIVRRDDDAVLSVLPENSEVTVRIRDSRNNVVQARQLISNQFGTVNGEFKIAEGAMLGNYAVEIVLDDESHRQVFKVQDYRKPDYEVTVAADATSYVAGDTIRVTVDSRYFFGEPVPNADITIRQYELGVNYCWEVCTDEATWFDLGREAITGKTDANGRFSFTLTASLGNYGRNIYWWSDLRQSTIGLEATVDDGSHQTVSSFAAVKVFNAAEQIRLDTGGYLKTPGQPFTVQASARTIFDQPITGRALRLQLRQWNSDDRDYTAVIHSVNLTTDANGLASGSLSVEKSGYYQAHLVGRDRRGNEIAYNRWLYVFSEADRWTGQSSGLSIVADRDTYAPGETATLLVESPISGPALLTVERGTTRREQLINLTAPVTRLEFPIRSDDAPNIFVAVNVWAEQNTDLSVFNFNRDDWYYNFTTIADSKLMTAHVELHVPVTDKTLTVTITPDKQTYAPREPATFTVRVANGRGEPVAAEVSLALVDEAIFSLSDELSGPIFDAFYFERDNIVRTYNSMAPFRYLPCECGGGGGDGRFGPSNPRSNFPDTAAWAPVLHTNWKGEAVVTFTLPDNLTSWRLTAKAATADTQVGETFINVVTKQEIVVRPLLPRALTAGDQVELSAIVHNYGETRREVIVSIEADGLKFATPITQTISLRVGEQKIVGWAATAVEAGEAAITVSAQAGEAGDAVKLTIPIRPLAIPDVTTQVGDFTGVFNTTITMPEGALDLSTVKIELSRSIAGSLLTGLEYLTGFPYGCVEQTMSKALPNAVVGRAFHQLGVSNPTVQADLPPKINASVQRLYGYQHNDGGWGWWYDDETDAYQTAWVVFGLSVTAEAGYEVDSGVIRRGVDWLSQNLNQMDIRTRAFALYSMSVAGYGDLEATQTLAKRSGELDTFSRAALALALHKLGAAADAQKMLDVLAETAVVKDGKVYWPNGDDDGHYQQKTMSSTTRSTALALEAFVRINPNHPLEPGIVRYLMSQRRRDGWGSTNETSFTILALTDHLLAKETATADTDYAVELNGNAIASGTLGRGEPAVSLEIPAAQLRGGDNGLRIRQGGGGLLYYVISSRVFLAQSEVEAAGDVKVTRIYADPKTNKAITSVAAGQLVKVLLKVTLPEDGFYILVEDKLPGGLEALNEGLNTTSHEASAYGYEPAYYWRSYGYNNKEVRGDRVSFFTTEFDKGARTFTYYARATRAGQFVAMPTEVWAMYDLSVWGRSASSELVVEK